MKRLQQSIVDAFASAAKRSSTVKDADGPEPEPADSPAELRHDEAEHPQILSAASSTVRPPKRKVVLSSSTYWTPLGHPATCMTERSTG